MSASRSDRAPDRGPGRGHDPGDDPKRRVAAALAELERVARELLEKERQVLPEAKVDAVELPVLLNFHGADTRVAGEFRLAEAEKLVELLRGRVREALLHAVAFERGHVFCLRCESSRCAHSSPPSPRSVFAGYEETGRPDWIELDKLLHRRGDPRIDRVYASADAYGRGGGRELVAVALHRDDVYGRLLPGFDEPRWRCYVLGQVCVGYFVPVSDARNGGTEPMALTVQVVRTDRQGADGPMVGINLVGRIPGSDAQSQPLEETILEPLPDALRQLRREIGVFSGRGGSRAPGVGIALERLVNRCHQLLKDSCRDLEHRRRAEGRRTGHARERARQGDRPTHKALEDAHAAGDDRLYFDVQEKTVCVLGPSNRVHFFTLAGKQVTSIVFPGHVVQSRVASKRWAALEPEKRAAFRSAIEPRHGPHSSEQKA